MVYLNFQMPTTKNYIFNASPFLWCRSHMLRKNICEYSEEKKTKQKNSYIEVITNDKQKFLVSKTTRIWKKNCYLFTYNVYYIYND